MLKEFKNRKEELEKASQKNLYDDYTGNPLDDDPEIEALLDLIESIKYFTSRY